MFRHASYAWLTTQDYRRIPWTPQLTAYFQSHFERLTEGLYVRTAHPIPGQSAG